MNFAMICDVVGGGMKSYYIKDKKGYDFNDIPYDFNVSIGNEFYISIWNYPSLYDGYFINWAEWGDDLPDLELDLIFLSFLGISNNSYIFFLLLTFSFLEFRICRISSYFIILH